MRDSHERQHWLLLRMQARELSLKEWCTAEGAQDMNGSMATELSPAYELLLESWPMTKRAEILEFPFAAPAKCRSWRKSDLLNYFLWIYR
jgi:hypothetical protein